MNRKSSYKNIEKWKESCRRWRRKYYGKTAFAVNHNQPWTDEEIELVMRHDVPDHTISEIIGRSVQSIQMTRWRENKKRSVRDGRSPMDKDIH